MSEAKYNIKDLLEKDGCIEIITDGGTSIPVTLELLHKLVPRGVDRNKKPVREPTTTELLMYGSLIIDQKLNPYLKECWCYWLKGAYTSVVSSMARMRKVQLQPDYEGWKWGWITKNGTRADQGATVLFLDIIGAWADVHRKGRLPWHHEIFVAEYSGTFGQWKERQFTMFSKVLRDQAHRLAYSDIMGNLSTENETPFFHENDPEPTKDPLDQIKQDMGSKVISSVEVVSKTADKTVTRHIGGDDPVEIKSDGKAKTIALNDDGDVIVTTKEPVKNTVEGQEIVVKAEKKTAASDVPEWAR